MARKSRYRHLDSSETATAAPFGWVFERMTRGEIGYWHARLGSSGVISREAYAAATEFHAFIKENQHVFKSRFGRFVSGGLPDDIDEISLDYLDPSPAARDFYLISSAHRSSGHLNRPEEVDMIAQAECLAEGVGSSDSDPRFRPVGGPKAGWRVLIAL